MIEYHKYNLRYLDGRSRSGLLLRVDGGYSDLMPWPELGEASLSEVLSVLRAPIDQSTLAQARLSSARNLILNAIDAARTEAKAFEAGTCLLKESIENHALMLRLSSNEQLLALTPYDLKAIRAHGYRAIKIKVDLSSQPAVDLAIRQFQQMHWSFGDEMKYRIDCNEQSNTDLILDFLTRIPIRVRDQIDFLEDPCPWNLNNWRRICQQTGVPLAVDRPIDSLTQEADELIEVMRTAQQMDCVHVFVFKPSYSVKKIESLMRGCPSARRVFTSNLGHPVGLIGAAAMACEYGTTDEIHGCHSVSALDPSQACVKSFRKALRIEKTTPWLTPSAHAGCGLSRRDLESFSFETASLLEELLVGSC